MGYLLVPLLKYHIIFPARKIETKGSWRKSCIGKLSACEQDLCSVSRDPLETMHNSFGGLVAYRHRPERMMGNLTVCISGRSVGSSSRLNIAICSPKMCDMRMRCLWVLVQLWLRLGDYESSYIVHCDDDDDDVRRKGRHDRCFEYLSYASDLRVGLPNNWSIRFNALRASRLAEPLGEL